jgi:hypothetical protein
VENEPRVLGPKTKIDLQALSVDVIEFLLSSWIFCPERPVPGPLTEKIQTIRGSVG